MWRPQIKPVCSIQEAEALFLMSLIQSPTINTSNSEEMTLNVKV